MKIINFYVSKSGAYYGFHFGAYVGDPNGGKLEINIDNIFSAAYEVINKKIIWRNDDIFDLLDKEIKEAAENYVRQELLKTFL